MFYFTKNTRQIFLGVLLTKLNVSMINLANQFLFTKERMQLKGVIKQLLRSKGIAQGWEKHFNKNFVMTVEDKKDFKTSNKLFAKGDNKVRDL